MSSISQPARTSAELKAGNQPNWADRKYGQGIDTYYGVPPYPMD